jgi:adiponectin receptor
MLLGAMTDLFDKHRRSILFITLAGSGYIPIIHGYLISGIDGLRQFPLTHTLIMDVVYLIGVGFYLTHFPESRYPTKFDIWVSHKACN